MLLKLHLNSFYPETFDKEIKMDNLNKPNVALITCILDNETGIGEMFVVNFLQIIEPFCGKIFLITGNFLSRANEKVQIINIKCRSSAKIRPIWIRIPRCILMQLRLSANLIKVSKNVSIVIFYLGGQSNLLPMLCSKLLRKKTITFNLGGRKAYEMSLTEPSGMGRFIFPRVVKMLQGIVFSLTDQIALETENVIQLAGLNKYRKKISITGAVYIDTDNFKIKKNLKDKRNLIGYIGRLSPEKGVLNFAKAIPLILKERNDLDFLIGGNGPLFDEIKNVLKNSRSYDKVELAGWIPHDELQKYLNELKLIISPSYTEGGVPAVIMEAMACGTIVLVTPVAGVDVIKEGKSGFILEDNSPECIAKNVIRVLEHPNLEEIISKAHNLVEEKFSYKKVVKQYRDMLHKVLSDKKK